jgi:glycosyltransferase involved in cell wall biosynthesis
VTVAPAALIEEAPGVDSIEPVNALASPRVSVVMPVHNGLPYLDDSIGSILGQSLDDFELVILDDASTDGTGAALREWQRKDGRVRIIASARPLGLAGSSNRVVAEARAPLIARMDADDLAHRDRLQRQCEVFQAHADASLVGTLWEGIDERGRRVGPRDRWRLVRRSSFAPFPHGSTMFRRRAFDEIGGYRQACEFWEDLDFFLRLSTTGRVFVLPDVLYAYRFHGNSSRLTSEADVERVEGAIGLMYRCMADRRAGRDYGPRLAERRVPQRMPPSVFISLGSARLWSGQAPAVLGALWRRGALAWDVETATALTWAVLGAISPRALRLGLRILTRVRDLVAACRLKNRRPREWRAE